MVFFVLCDGKDFEIKVMCVDNLVLGLGIGVGVCYGDVLCGKLLIVIV